MNSLKTELAECGAKVNAFIEQSLTPSDPELYVLYEAMRYSALSGGKRIRPFLTLEFSKLFGGTETAALPFAAAIELVHASSLVHDDMPCMDNDDLRRGRPTNHVVYGENIALLCGDALITRGYELASLNAHVFPRTALLATSMLLKNAGAVGMMGGQFIDLEGEKRPLSFDELLMMHSKKTGALIRAAAKLGCYAAGITADNSREMLAADEYAAGIGLAFQIVDDVLDACGDEKLLGKKTGMDVSDGKTTFLSFMSPAEALEYAGKETEKAKRAIEPFNGKELLCNLAEYLLNRNN